MSASNPEFDVSQPVNTENLRAMVARHNNVQHLDRMVRRWLAAQEGAKAEKPTRAKKKEAA